jgi:SAM-dependent methyltransferase
MSVALFESEAERYDALIDWERRLARERPFFENLLGQLQPDARSATAPQATAPAGRALRVLDAACGTGRHARLFTELGCAVEGADCSLAMITHCRSRHGESDHLRWVVRSFETPPDPRASFDLAVCIGNSLALVENPGAVERAVAALTQAVRPGGLVIVQVLNLWKLPDGAPVWQKVVSVPAAGQPALLIKGVQRSAARGWVHVLSVHAESAAPRITGECAALLGLRFRELEQAVLRAGGLLPQAYGGYDRSPYDEAQSEDLILTWRRV